jgi:uncharacterized protein (TIGR03437 family)
MRQILFAFSLAAMGWAQPKFTITDLGTLPNLGACIATAISPNGNVAGYCHVAGQSVGVSQSQGFLYSQGKLTALPQGSGPQVAVGVNDAGTVIGLVVPQGQDITTDLFGGGALGFLVQGAKSTSLPQYIWPAGINNAGQVAAIQVLPTNAAQTLTGLSAATVYDSVSGKFTTLPGGSASASSLALAIAQKGDVVGASYTLNILNASLLFQGAQWRGGTFYSLPPPSGSTSAAAFATNDSGLAGGVSFSVSYTGGLSLSSFAFKDLHPVIWTNYVPTDLTTMLGSKYGAVQGVNNLGWATGFKADTLGANGLGPLDLLLFPDSQNFTAFLYTGGKTYDLNTLVTNASGWTLTNAIAVNDAGQIVGAGFVNGQEHAFLLTPTGSVTPVVTISGIAGAANSIPTVSSISANGYFTVYGSGFTSDTTVQRGLQGTDIVNNLLPTNLANTCVNAGGTRAFLRFVSTTQINALAPALPATGPVPVSVVLNCGTGNEVTSPTVSVPVAAASPEFLYWVANTNGQNPVIALDAVSGAPIGPPGMIPGLNVRAAKTGDILTLYAISFGKTASGGPVPGGIPSIADAVAGPVSLKIGGTPVTPSYVGVTPGSAGLYQMNVTIPSGLTAGNNTVVLTINGISTPAGGFLTVTP